MVPLTAGPTVASVRSGLHAAAYGDAPDHVLAFRAWVLGDVGALPGFASASVDSLATPAGRSHRLVATLGYAASVDCLDDGARRALTEGLAWLADVRWNRPFQPLTLEADGVSMLGIALGIRAVGRCSCSERIAGLALQGAAMPDLSGFARSLMVASAHLLGADGRPDPSAMLPEARLALAQLGLVPGEGVDGQEAWERAIRYLPGEGEVAQAAVTLRAFDAICSANMSARVGRLEAQDVVRILRGVPAAMRNWTWERQARTKRSSAVRWDIQNEYHVQNLLWAILAPLFADLAAEENAPSVGQKNPRMDLVIPSLRLVIEVKFLRSGARFADVVEQIAADASLYRTDARWQLLIPFIWDDSRRVEEHDKLVEGLRRLDMIHDAVVVSRPGKMDETEACQPVPSGEAIRPSG